MFFFKLRFAYFCFPIGYAHTLCLPARFAPQVNIYSILSRFLAISCLMQKPVSDALFGAGRTHCLCSCWGPTGCRCFFGFFCRRAYLR